MDIDAKTFRDCGGEERIERRGAEWGWRGGEEERSEEEGSEWLHAGL